MKISEKSFQYARGRLWGRRSNEKERDDRGHGTKRYLHCIGFNSLLNNSL